MANSGAVYAQISKLPNIKYPLLVPNLKGLQDALSIQAQEIAIFGAASDTFSKKNINCSIVDSMARFQALCETARQVKPSIWIRGYISCVLGCPYEGPVKSKAVISVMEKMLHMGCHEISLGDTIGVGTPGISIL
jgi:hydroxymethylglutaryl-CoA lyase